MKMMAGNLRTIDVPVLSNIRLTITGCGRQKSALVPRYTFYRSSFKRYRARE
jgi:hypothetical protein